MRQRFTIIEGGAAGSPVETYPTDGPVTWRVDLRRAHAIHDEEIEAWRALLVRAAGSMPDRSVYADPDFLLSVAQHQAGGRDIVFALAWASGGGPERPGLEKLGAVVPLVLPHTLWGHGRIVLWHPHGIVLTPIRAAAGIEALQGALVDCLRRLRPQSSLDLDLSDAALEVPPGARIRLATRHGGIPSHNLVGIRPPQASPSHAPKSHAPKSHAPKSHAPKSHAPKSRASESHAASPMRVERISEPHRIRDAVEAFLLHDAEVSSAPIIGDPSEAALVRVVTRLFARRRQVTVALAHREDRIVAATISLGAGEGAVVWRRAEGVAKPDRVDRSA